MSKKNIKQEDLKEINEKILKHDKCVIATPDSVLMCGSAKEICNMICNIMDSFYEENPNYCDIVFQIYSHRIRKKDKHLDKISSSQQALMKISGIIKELDTESVEGIIYALICNLINESDLDIDTYLNKVRKTYKKYKED